MTSKPLDPVMQSRMKAKLEKSIPDLKERRAALEPFADTIETLTLSGPTHGVWRRAPRG